MTTAQICEQCGAPMTNRRKCDHCRTIYYTGPDVVDSPYPDKYNMANFNSLSSSMVFTTVGGQIPHSQYPTSPYVERMYGQ